MGLVRSEERADLLFEHVRVAGSSSVPAVTSSLREFPVPGDAMTVDCSKERNAEETTYMQAKQDLPLLHLDPPSTASILLTPLS